MSLNDIITPEWLRERFLFGVDLTDDDGQSYPDSLYQHAIDSAISVIESDIDIVLNGPTTYVERRDTTDFHTESFFLTNLDHRPVLNVSQLSVQFGDYPEASIPRGWLHISNWKAGQIQVLPGPEGIGSIIFGGTAPFLGLAGLYGRPYTPLWFKLKYDAGFEYDLSGTVATQEGIKTVTGTGTYFVDPYSDPAFIEIYGANYGGGFVPRLSAANYVKIVGTVGGETVEEIHRVKSVSGDTTVTVDSPFENTMTGASITLMQYPPSILDAVGLVAAMLPLDTAGDLIVGAGIASKSVSMDGLSTNINTTASSTNAGYGARMLSYRNRLKSLLSSIRRDYRAPHMMIA